MNKGQAYRHQQLWRIPEFDNLGTILRAALLINALALVSVILQNRESARFLEELLNFFGNLEPPLTLTLALLYAFARPLRRLPPRLQAALTVTLTGLVTLAFFWAIPWQANQGNIWRPLLWACGAAIVALLYFHLLLWQHAPALAEARLMALSARIRPHFLFNTLNSVLGILRDDPHRAESALEELSDLFRALMKENMQLVSLADEIELSRRYIALEKLRLGERLQVHWLQENVSPEKILVPALLLQPLLENAVYHGIEPSSKPGAVSVKITRRGVQLFIEVINPIVPQTKGVDYPKSKGNQMALNNILERLRLFYDLEAALYTNILSAQYHITVQLPYREITSTKVIPAQT